MPRKWSEKIMRILATIILVIGILGIIGYLLGLTDSDVCPKCGGKMIAWSSKKSYCEKCDYTE
jgi:hypothetical protein